MYTTIIISFHRLSPVPLCLTSLEICEGIDQHQVILMQQGGSRFEFDTPDLNLKYVHVADDGPFNLAKLHNAAVKSARTEWVTFLDPCLVVPPNFSIAMEDSTQTREHRLIYFPIRHLDSEITDLITVVSGYNSNSDNCL